MKTQQSAEAELFVGLQASKFFGDDCQIASKNWQTLVKFIIFIKMSCPPPFRTLIIFFFIIPISTLRDGIKKPKFVYLYIHVLSKNQRQLTKKVQNLIDFCQYIDIRYIKLRQHSVTTIPRVFSWILIYANVAALLLYRGTHNPQGIRLFFFLFFFCPRIIEFEIFQ